MEDLTTNEKAYLVQSCLRSPVVLRRTAGQLDLSQDFDPQEEFLRYLWAALDGFWTKYGSSPDRRMLFTELQAAHDEDQRQHGFSPLAQPEVSESIRSIVSDAESEDFVPNEQYAKDILQRMLDNRVHRQAIDITANSSVGLDDMMNTLSESYKNTRIPDEDCVYDPTDLNDPRISEVKKTPPTPSGFKVFDALVGGYRQGHALGFLASSGSGKTSFCIQATTEVARQGGCAWYFTYEQKVSGELHWRFWSCASGLSEDHFYEVDFGNPDDRTAQRLRDSLAEIKGKAYFVDCVQHGMGGNGMRDIEIKLEQAEAAGKPKPDLVVVDWLGIMAEKVIAHQGLDIDQKRQVMNNICAECKRLAERFECQVIITNQLNAVAGASSPSHRPTQYDSSDTRMFANLLDGCLIVSNPDINKVAQVYTGKMRGEQKGLFVRIIGEHCRMQIIEGSWSVFRHADGSYEWTNEEADAVGMTA